VHTPPPLLDRATEAPTEKAIGEEIRRAEEEVATEAAAAHASEIEEIFHEVEPVFKEVAALHKKLAKLVEREKAA
jgi:ubiquinone biosynthesis protein UbiJ